MQAANTFGRLLDLLAPYQQAPLPPPASEGALSELQEHLGVMLPPGLLAAYRVCDGSPREGEALAQNLFYSFRFLSVAEVREQWGSLASSASYNPMFPSVPSHPPGAVQESYIAAGWVPFAHDRAGGNLAIDYAPGPAGKVGQVINYGRDDAVHFVLADDFDGFLQRVVGDYEARRHHHFFGDKSMYVDRLTAELRQP